MNETKKYHALKVDTERCFGCTHCMRICPTEAIRIMNGIAEINDEKCVDCGNCLRVCPAGAFFIEHDPLLIIEAYKYRVVLLPSVFIGQFSEDYSEGCIYEALLQIGFTHIYEVEQPAGILMEAIRNMDNELHSKPLISSFCPAIVRLIQRKYPSMAENICRRKAPHDLAALFAEINLRRDGANASEIGIFYVTPCSAKMAAVVQPVAEEKSMVTGIINMKDLYNQVMKHMLPYETYDTSRYRKFLSREGILWSLPQGEASWFGGKSMAIDGIHNVVKFLERLENDDVPQLDFLELKACNQGCSGGILLTGNRFLTAERLQKRAASYPTAEGASVDLDLLTGIMPQLITEYVEPAPVFVLDQERAKALSKMDRMEKILCQLPGIDCGACGAPSCHALAEDVVLGNRKLLDCIFLQNFAVLQHKLNPEKAETIRKEIWGIKRFESDCKRKGGRNEGF